MGIVYADMSSENKIIITKGLIYIFDHRVIDIILLRMAAR